MNTSWKRVLSGLLVLALALVAGAAQASAGGDPYGSTTTTTEPSGIIPTCNLTVNAGAPGTSVTATVQDVPLGQTVRILFDGQEVGRGTAEGDVVANAASPAVLLGGVARPVGTATTTVTVNFVVPDRPPGDYIVTAVGDTFTCFCNPGGVFSVLAAGGQGRGDGSLPRTGIYVGLLVVVGGGLLLAGRAFVAESKRRRRRAARSAGSRTRAGV